MTYSAASLNSPCTRAASNIKAFQSALLGCFFAILLLFPSLAEGHGAAVEIEPASGATIDAGPRTVTTVALRITNHSGAGEFEASLALPQGWRLITQEQPFTLARDASIVRLLSFFVPESAAAGEHALTYSVTNRRQPAIQGSYSVSMRVASSLKLQLTLLDLPDLVIAGEPYTGTFVLHNKGNAAVSVDYKAHSSRSYAVDPPAGTLTLEPGASRELKLRVATQPAATLERDWLVLVAQARGVATSERATGAIKVAPRVTGTERRYNTIPATVGLRVVTQEKDGRRTSGTQAEITGGGKIADSGERAVHFLLRGPDTVGKSVFGLPSEYRVDYADTALGVSLGDLGYGLSPLTELGRYGRGAAASYHAGKATLRAFVMRDRFSSSTLGVPSLAVKPIPEDANRITQPTELLPATAASEHALSAAYAYNDNGQLELNYLQKKDASCPSGSAIYSVRNTSHWGAQLNSDVELGQSSCAGVRGNAFRGDLSDRRYPLKYNVSVMRADADYRGSSADQQLATFFAEYPLTGALSVRVNHRTQQSNQQAAPTRAAPGETQSGVGLGYRFQGGAWADLEYIGRTTVDRRPLPDFDARHHAARVVLRQQYNGLSLYGSVELGTTSDELRQNRFPTRQLLTSAHWAVSDRLYYGAYLFYVDNAYTFRKEAPQTSAGATIHYLFSGQTVLDANLQASRAQTASVGADVTLSHRRANGDVVALALRRGAGGATQTQVMLTYTVPLAIPVSKRTNVASVTGRVFDQESGQGVPNLVLRLGGIVAVSGNDGGFSFPSVRIGTYYLSIDQVTGVSGKIPAQSMPMEVDVRQGADASISIPLVQSAELTGSITVLEPEPATGTAATVGAEPGQVALAVPRNLLVIFRKDTVEYKRLTDENGKFHLGRITPGRWTVSVAEDGLPVGYELEKKSFLVDLAPGKDAAVEFKLRQKIRAIKMLQQMTPVG